MERGSFLVNTYLISPFSVAKVYAVFSTKITSSVSDGLPKAMVVTYIIGGDLLDSSDQQLKRKYPSFSTGFFYLEILLLGGTLSLGRITLIELFNKVVGF